MPTQSSKAEAIPSKLRAGFSSSSPRGASISLSSTREPDPARKRAAIFARRSDARGRVTARYCLGPHCHPAALGSPCPRNAPPPPRPPPLAEPMPSMMLPSPCRPPRPLFKASPAGLPIAATRAAGGGRGRGAPRRQGRGESSGMAVWRSASVDLGVALAPAPTSRPA